MREVAVIGVGMTKFGRFPEKTILDLGREAILDAIKDAGIDIRDVQVMYSGSQYQPGMTGQYLLKQVGMTMIPVVNVVNACATGSTAVREAYYAVASGAYDMALAVGAEQMGKMGLLGVGASDPQTSAEGIIGTSLMPGIFAELGVRHMAQYGTKPEHFAKVAVKNHKYSVYNPRSQYRKAYTLEEVMTARMICWPNTLYMCCPTGDGAAAVVLCDAAKARQYTTRFVKILASVMTTPAYTPESLGFVEIATMTRRAADEAYEKTGLGPEDLDVVELHDCFATAELLHYENLHFCEWGEGGRMIDEGATEINGRIPVNMSGGLLSKGHPIGATGVAQVCELVWQLRGDAPTRERQVPDAKVAMGHVQGGFEVCTVHILGV
ncbi:MAG: thiolase family protein [Dehalococcoidia bacterium]|nr:thiolase family protein [Dehalococcoidia bacterium]